MSRLRDSSVPLRRAYTLVEMLVVVAIVLIVAALAIPMIGQTSTARLISAAEVLQADLDFARVASINHADDPRLVVFDTDEHGYHIAAASAPDTALMHPVDKQPYLVHFGQGRALHMAGVTISNLNVGDDDRVQFGIYGQLDQTTPATVTLSANGKSITLTLDATTGETTIGDVQ